MALVAMAPAAAEPGGQAAALLRLAAALSWWPAVVLIVRSDLSDFIIPDGASLATAALGLAAAVGAPLLSGDGWAAAAAAGGGALAVGLAGFALFWLVAAGFALRGRDALGFGDVKLAGAAALWLSPADAALALEIAALGAIALLLAARRSGPPSRLRDAAVPFGAFMAPAAWLVFVLGPILQGAMGWGS